jgi:hypothetical protein
LINARTRKLDEEHEKIPVGATTKVETLTSLMPHELDEDELEDYTGKQSTLNDLGVTDLLAKIVSSVDDISPGCLADYALELLVEILNGGNASVADTLYNHLVKQDTEGKFINHLAMRLKASSRGIKEYKTRGFFGTAEATAPADEFISLCEECIQTSRLLQLLCEGHNHRFQELIRDQPMYRSKHNLVDIVIEMLTLTCESSALVGNFKEIELDLVTQLLSTLTESMTGPCGGNQERIVDSDAILAVNSIMAAANSVDIEKGESDSHHQSIRSSACVLVASCLEGRRDFVLHGQLRQKLELHPLSLYKEEVEHVIRSIRKDASSMTRSPDFEEESRIKNAQDALIAILTIATELRIEFKSAADEESGNNKKRKHKARHDAADELPLVGVVEVAWKGKIERSVFPLPPEINYLSEANKKLFRDTVDLSTTEKRNGTGTLLSLTTLCV